MEFLQKALVFLENMAHHQQERVFAIAKKLDPRLTADDLLQPHDVAVLQSSTDWHYEDGVLAGLRSAHMGLRNEFLST